MHTAVMQRRVTAEEYQTLEELARSTTRIAERAQIVLAVLEGACPASLAGRYGVPRTTVYSWVRRFAASGVTGLENRRRDGRMAYRLR